MPGQENSHYLLELYFKYSSSAQPSKIRAKAQIDEDYIC